MLIEETHLKGCFVITPKVFSDDRGYFFESFNYKVFSEKTGLKPKFVQDNQSQSSKGTLRGLHYQTGKYAQAKLVRVTQGKVLDVAVDLRPNSPTFKNHFSIILDAKKHQQIFIPRGFAHGFLSLENFTIFNYKCDNYYNKSYEKGIIYNDKTLSINWNYDSNAIKISEKDKTLPTFETLFK